MNDFPEDDVAQLHRNPRDWDSFGPEAIADHLQHEIQTLKEDLGEYRELLDARTEELDDWREGARQAASEKCGDERHCTCVPALRAKLAKAEEALERIHDQVKSKHFKADMAYVADALGDALAALRGEEKIASKTPKVDNAPE